MHKLLFNMYILSLSSFLFYAGLGNTETADNQRCINWIQTSDLSAKL